MSIDANKITVSTYQEAESEAKMVPWKLVLCETDNCWCSGITTKNDIEYGNPPEEFYIIPIGTIHRSMAEYIVNLHNKYFITA